MINYILIAEIKFFIVNYNSTTLILYMSTLAQNLKRLRKVKGFTQEKLARLTDLTNNTIIKIEAGKNKNPTLDTLKGIAKALGVSVDELIN
jgi:transcriptional regulator with XRE-family HTH domain